MLWANPLNDNNLCVEQCWCVWKKGGEEVARLLNHSLPPSCSPSIRLHLPLFGGVSAAGTAPVLWHTVHTSTMCHYTFHLPLPVIPRSIYPHLLIPSQFLFFLKINFLGGVAFIASLHSSMSSIPPMPCVTAAVKKERCCCRQVRRQRRKQNEWEKIVRSVATSLFATSKVLLWWKHLGMQRLEGGEEETNGAEKTGTYCLNRVWRQYWRGKKDGLSLPITFLTISAFLSHLTFFILVSSRLSAELCTRALFGTWTNCEAVS